MQVAAYRGAHACQRPHREQKRCAKHRCVECSIQHASSPMGFVRLFSLNAAIAPEADPTAELTAPSTAPSKDGRLGATCDGTNLRHPHGWHRRRPIRAGFSIRASRQTCNGAVLAAAKPLQKFYTAICRSQGIDPFPWPSVLRHVNGILKAVYGPTYKKTYKRVHERYRFRNWRVYRVPLLEEAARASGRTPPASLDRRPALRINAKGSILA